MVPKKQKQPELLAPAGDSAQMESAIRGGADAVYFGAASLNARRGAENFTVSELPAVMSKLHRSGVKGYLAVNISLTHRELGQAAKILRQAREARLDGVLIADPALLLLAREFFKDITLHWSTQAAVTSSAGVEAARRLGVERVILPREMSLEEIKKASSVEGVETEVFVQGALCFGVSGRCLLSSWGVGRSGNRGLCASPCRVPWRVDGRAPKQIFSMRDLCLIQHVRQLVDCGVSALKIEGRLKTAEWTFQAVKAYRAVLDGESPASVEHLTRSLGDYTGRAFTDDYLMGRNDNLISSAARPASDDSETGGKVKPRTVDTAAPERLPQPVYRVYIKSEGNKLHCSCVLPDSTSREKKITCPKAVKKNRGIRLELVKEKLQRKEFNHAALGDFAVDDPERLIPRRVANGVVDWIGSVLHQQENAGRKSEPGFKHGQAPYVKLDPPAESNILSLGRSPNRVRLRKDSVKFFFDDAEVKSMVVEDLSSAEIKELLPCRHDKQLCVALPPVFFEDDLDGLRELVYAAAAFYLPVEVNSWDGWRLADEAQAKFETGPGMVVLNPWAIQMLKTLGCQCATISLEADKEQLESSTSLSPLPCCVYVAGRPPLAITRARVRELTDKNASARDRRGIVLSARRKKGLTYLYSREPFSYAGIANESVKAQWLAMDLTASSDPYKEWRNFSPDQSSNFQTFNYRRKLR